MFEWWIVLSFQFVIFILVKNNLHKTFAQLACFNNFTFLCFFSCDNCFYKRDMLPLVFFLLLCFSKVLPSSSGQDCLWKLPTGMLLRFWHWWILWYFLAGFKTIILCLVHSNTIYKMCFLLRYGLWKFQLKSCNILNRTLQNMIFEFLSPTFSFHSSFFEFLSPTFSFQSFCYICFKFGVIFWYSNLSLYFWYLPFLPFILSFVLLHSKQSNAFCSSLPLALTFVLSSLSLHCLFYCLSVLLHLFISFSSSLISLLLSTLSFFFYWLLFSSILFIYFAFLLCYLLIYFPCSFYKFLLSLLIISLSNSNLISCLLCYIPGHVSGYPLLTDTLGIHFQNLPFHS